MGRLKKGINGALSGKLGTIVGANTRGVDYVRSVPKRSTKPPTPAQLKQRKKFGLIMSWLRPVLELINIGFRLITGSQTPINRAISYHLKEAVIEQDGDYGIDFKNALFSRGELIVSWILEVLCLAGSLLKIKWEDQSEHAFCKSDDRASFIVYNPVKEQFACFQDAALRSEQEVVLNLPENFAGDTVHCWMSYLNQDGDMVSTSTYLGELLIT